MYISSPRVLEKLLTPDPGTSSKGKYKDHPRKMAAKIQSWGCLLHTDTTKLQQNKICNPEKTNKWLLYTIVAMAKAEKGKKKNKKPFNWTACIDTG